MEPEGSSPHSQKPAACPSPEQDQSSPYAPYPCHVFKIHFNIILSPSTHKLNITSTSLCQFRLEGAK